jgi:hypothetical protein
MDEVPGSPFSACNDAIYNADAVEIFIAPGYGDPTRYLGKPWFRAG